MNGDEFLKTFIVDESDDAIVETKSKDKIKVQFWGSTTNHFASEYSTVFHYQTYNETKAKKGQDDLTNDVFFWRTRDEHLLMVSCSCISKLRCKHIVWTYKAHKSALEIGFIQE